MSKKPYAEQIRIPTDKASDNAVLRKHSEMKKPYLSDNYEEMEYFADAPVGFAFAPPGIDMPWMGTPVPDFEGAYDPWHLTFMCTKTSEDCYCEGGEKCFNLTCTYEIIGIDVHDSGLTATVSDPQVCVTAPEGESGSVEIDVHMRALRPWPSPHGSSKYVYGTHYNISLPACKPSECDTCDSGTSLAWDSFTETIDEDEDTGVVYTVEGSGSPFTWTIEGGEEFYLNSERTLTTIQTDGNSATVYTKAGACGAGRLTVEDCSEATISDSIRCNDNSEWQFCDKCTYSYPSGLSHPTIYEGGIKWYLNCGNDGGLPRNDICTKSCNEAGCNDWDNASHTVYCLASCPSGRQRFRVDQMLYCYKCT